MALFGGQRDISLFRHINRELINDIIDTKVDIVKHAIKDIKAPSSSRTLVFIFLATYSTI